MKSVLYSLFGVIAGFILAGILLFVSRAPAGEPIVLQPAPTEAPIEIHILGGVARPGLYKLPENARVQDAIDAAGGLLTTADTGTINLAAKVEDGQQLNIPCKDNSCPVSETTLELPVSTEDPSLRAGDAGGDTSGTEVCNPELVNINTASADELANVHHGIGPTTAQNIVTYRDANGPFTSIDDLVGIGVGLGATDIENLRPYITACP